MNSSRLENKHLIKIITEYLTTTNPYLNELVSSTKEIYNCVKEFTYYNKYKINHIDNLIHPCIIKNKTGYRKYDGWGIYTSY